MKNQNYQNNGVPFRNNYNQPQNQPYRPQQTQQKKHSGCELRTSFVDKTTGEIIEAKFMTAWNYSKSRGMLKIIASPRKDKAKLKTVNPKFENWAVKVFFSRTLETRWFNGFYDVTKQKITVKDMEFILNPKAKNGGYCGTYLKS